MLQNRNEVLDELLDAIADYEDNDNDFETMWNEVFNSDDRNVYYKEADEDTKKFVSDESMDGYDEDDGVWGAIKLVRDYEMDQFDKVNTEISPCAIANMIDYIRSESVLNDVLNQANLDINDSMTAENCSAVKKVINAELND